jgi:hypothetical protein
MDSNISRSKYCEPVSEVVFLRTEYRFAESMDGATHEEYETLDIFD